MNTASHALRTVLVMLLIVSCFSTAAMSADTATVMRIGTYDSRFVALAYYRSDNMKCVQDFMNNIAIDRADAVTAGDEQRIKEIDARGPAFQNLMHQQVFGNLSIPNVIDTIKDKLPAVAEAADVTMIVSKWDIGHAIKDVELVDVTPQLLALFDIDDTTRKMIDDGMQTGQEPVPVMNLLNPYE